jgi:hypothetical protein
MKLATKRKLAFWMLAAGFAAMALSTWHYNLDRYGSDIYTEIFGNKIQRSLRSAAGRNAKTCGIVVVPRDSPVNNRCADSLDSAEGAFYTVYAISNADGVWYRGIARTPDGTYQEYQWKPAPDEVLYVFAGTDPEPVTCADPHTMHKTWQNVPTCTAEQ